MGKKAVLLVLAFLLYLTCSASATGIYRPVDTPYGELYLQVQPSGYSTSYILSLCDLQLALLRKNPDMDMTNFEDTYIEPLLYRMVSPEWGVTAWIRATIAQFLIKRELIKPYPGFLFKAKLYCTLIHVTPGYSLSATISNIQLIIIYVLEDKIYLEDALSLLAPLVAQLRP
jgi:hypothetical protein